MVALDPMNSILTRILDPSLVIVMVTKDAVINHIDTGKNGTKLANLEILSGDIFFARFGVNVEVVTFLSTGTLIL